MQQSKLSKPLGHSSTKHENFSVSPPAITTAWNSGRADLPVMTITNKVKVIFNYSCFIALMLVFVTALFSFHCSQCIPVDNEQKIDLCRDFRNINSHNYPVRRRNVAPMLYPAPISSQAKAPIIHGMYSHPHRTPLHSNKITHGGGYFNQATNAYHSNNRRPLPFGHKINQSTRSTAADFIYDKTKTLNGFQPIKFPVQLNSRRRRRLLRHGQSERNGLRFFCANPMDPIKRQQPITVYFYESK
jgi:hypothetical protein